MTKQPEALRLINNRQNAHLISWQANACAELRRLHEVNQELLEALGLADAMLRGAHMNANVVHKKVSATIAKATGEQA